ncbi:MAG: hypothetical protein LBQ50_04625 [Planctomycetaceae bacterium]|nr:hypothetical protein [Planctomycetaceae bacterium]
MRGTKVAGIMIGSAMTAPSASLTGKAVTGAAGLVLTATASPSIVSPAVTSGLAYCLNND